MEINLLKIFCSIKKITMYNRLPNIKIYTINSQRSIIGKMVELDNEFRYFSILCEDDVEMFISADKLVSIGLYK